MGCASQYDFCLTKGTNFFQDVALTDSFSEVLADPDDYQGVMVFREYQDDEAEVYLTLLAPIDVNSGTAAILLAFEATPTQTLSLPDWDVVAYVDLELKTKASVARLYNSKVEISQ